MKQKIDTDALIIGAGPAGLSCALYCARADLKTAVVDKTMFGGQPGNYLEIENYPGVQKTSGFELMESFEKQIDNFNVQKFAMQEIIGLNLLGGIKTVETEENIFCSRAIVISTGASAKRLGVANEKRLTGRGVSFCAVCDGAFYRDKTVAVVGGGNSALEEAIYLTKFAKEVLIIHRRNEFRASKVVQQRALENEKIKFMLNSVVLEIQGEERVESVVVKNLETQQVSNIKTDGVFPYIGLEPNSELFAGFLETDENGFIITDETMKTSIDGVYAIGDVRNTPLRQVITAASDGAIAAVYLEKYIQSSKNVLLDTKIL